MFDQHHFHDRRTTVHNSFKMLPHDTADAARLYGEIETKAREHVANAVAVNLGANNEVRVVRADVIRTHEMMGGCVKMRIIYKINGKLYDEILEVDDMALRRNVHRNIAHAMFEQLADKLSHQDQRLLSKEPY